jgi:hypothetical protein
LESTAAGGDHRGLRRDLGWFFDQWLCGTGLPTLTWKHPDNAVLARVRKR